MLGDGDFTLQCTFTLSSNREALSGLTFSRKRMEDTAFNDILVIPPPHLSQNAIDYVDTSLEARTAITRPNSSLVSTVIVTFNSTKCSDIAEYKLVVNYYSSKDKSLEKNIDVRVKGKSFINYYSLHHPPELKIEKPLNNSSS